MIRLQRAVLGAVTCAAIALAVFYRARATRTGQHALRRSEESLST